MKKIILLISLVFSLPAFAGYTYVIDTYQLLPDLFGTESMLVTGNGGGGGFFSWDHSSVTVESTSTLGQGTGGLWQIILADSSHLDFSGGELGELDINNSATATLTGGTITGIFSYQSAWKFAGDPPVLVPNPHIEIIYSGALPTLQTIYGLPHLVGKWGNGTGFSIYLPNITGYSPAIENIKFTIIPEPATLLIIGLGGLMIRQRRGKINPPAG